MKPKIIAVVGPTASGKTSLSIALAKQFNGEVISVDSRQIFAGMDIGTAKPSTSELNSIKHHLINNKSVNDDYNIYDYEKDALKSIESIFNKNDIAILVGGSGLYINTVLYGLDEMPGISTEVRNSLYLDLELKGIKKLQEKLKLLDPSSYRSIDINNPRRLIRALEVSISTGKSYSSFLKKKKKKRDFNIIVLGMNQERLDLYKKINTRVDNMVESGLINEVKELYTLKGLNTLNTIGYSEVFNYIEDKYSLDECINEIKKNTRRYAKRQLTWFKSIDRVEWITPDYTFEKVIAYIKSLIGN